MYCLHLLPCFSTSLAFFLSLCFFSTTPVFMWLGAKQVWGPLQVITFALLKLLALISCPTLFLSLLLTYFLFLHLVCVWKSPLFIFYLNSVSLACQMLTSFIVLKSYCFLTITRIILDVFIIFVSHFSATCSAWHHFHPSTTKMITCFQWHHRCYLTFYYFLEKTTMVSVDWIE